MTKRSIRTPRCLSATTRRRSPKEAKNHDQTSVTLGTIRRAKITSAAEAQPKPAHRFETMIRTDSFAVYRLTTGHTIIMGIERRSGAGCPVSRNTYVGRTADFIEKIATEALEAYDAGQTIGFANPMTMTRDEFMKATVGSQLSLFV